MKDHYFVSIRHREEIFSWNLLLDDILLHIATKVLRSLVLVTIASKIWLGLTRACEPLRAQAGSRASSFFSSLNSNTHDVDYYAKPI